MRKKKVSYAYFCDICGKQILDVGQEVPRCALCGKEICLDCSRFICKRAPVAQGTSGGFSWQLIPSPQYTEELRICKECTDSLKLTLHVVARKNKNGNKDNRH